MNKKISCIADICITMVILLLSVIGINPTMQFIVFVLSIAIVVVWFLLASYKKWRSPVLVAIVVLVLSLKSVHYAETPMWFNIISALGAAIFTIVFSLVRKDKGVVLICVYFLLFYAFWGGALSYANTALAHEEDALIEIASVKSTYIEGRFLGYTYSAEVVRTNGDIVHIDIPQNVYETLETGDSISIKRVKSFYAYYVFDKVNGGQEDGYVATLMYIPTVCHNIYTSQ